MNENLWKNIETIDNEEQKINETLEKKEDLIALWIIETIDKQISDTDIDLAVDRENNKFYFIANSKEALNIWFDLNKLPEFWAIMIKLFNHDIQLFGSLYWRSIAEDTWAIDWFEEKFISDWDFSKNEIEEIFVFVMKAKWIPMEDWKLESTVCKWWSNNSCKEALGK